MHDYVKWIWFVDSIEIEQDKAESFHELQTWALESDRFQSDLCYIAFVQPWAN